MYKIKVILLSAIVFTVCLTPCMNVSASTLNPAMGDTVGQYLWVFIAVAVVALIALVITAIMGKKGGKK